MDFEIPNLTYKEGSTPRKEKKTVMDGRHRTSFHFDLIKYAVGLKFYAGHVGLVG